MLESGVDVLPEAAVVTDTPILWLSSRLELSPNFSFKLRIFDRFLSKVSVNSWF